MRSRSSRVREIQTASRDLARELERSDRPLIGTGLSPSAVHALVELGAAGHLSAKMLAEKLLLEKSTVSRLVKSLVAKGIVAEARSERDRRVKNIQLTQKGQKLRAAIVQYSEGRVGLALASLPGPSQEQILAGLRSFAAALDASRDTGDSGDAAAPALGPTALHDGYTPGIIGRMVHMHATTYSRLPGFDVARFEAIVAAGLAEFMPRLENPGNNIWTVQQGGRIVGSIAIDGEGLGNRQAHLRWFITDEQTRGLGFGKAMFEKAMNFCDAQEFAEIRLWTSPGLDAARHIYETHGFTLEREYKGDQWGTEVMEQVFVRRSGVGEPVSRSSG